MNSRVGVSSPSRPWASGELRGWNFSGTAFEP